MKIQTLSPSAAVASAVEALGFDVDSVDLTVPEVIAASVRRAASFTCPCSPRLLASVVRRAATGLVANPDDEDLYPVRSAIDLLTAYGDLVEAPIVTERGAEQRILFLGAPSFVAVGRATLLVGIRAEGVPFLSGSEAGLVELDGHVRRMAADTISPEDLEGLGLRGVSVEHWLGMPPVVSPDDLVAEYDRRLDAAGPAGTIEEGLILDSAQPVTYYRGRWRPIGATDAGRFIARRPAAYGAPLWCYVEVKAGLIQRVLDLPIHDRLHRACDEAWRLQAAIDSRRGSPQRLRVDRRNGTDVAVLNLMSPLPGWAQRRLDTIARPIPRDRALISYAIALDDLDAEVEFLSQSLWTVRMDDREKA